MKENNEGTICSVLIAVGLMVVLMGFGFAILFQTLYTLPFLIFGAGIMQWGVYCRGTER